MSALLAFFAAAICQNQLPVVDLQAQIDRTPPYGELVLEPGIYSAPITLRRPIRLLGRPGAVLDAGGKGDVMLVTAPDVHVQGLTLRATGSSVDRENSALVADKSPRLTIQNCRFEDVLFGIYLKESPSSTIVGNVIRSKPLDQPRRGDAIRLWQSSFCRILQNDVRDSRDVVVWYSDQVVLQGNHVSHGRYGMHFMYSSRNILEDNVLVDNSVGAFLMYSKDLTMRRNVIARNDGPSGFGIGLKDMDGLLVEDNLLVDNRVGLHLDNSPMVASVHHLIRGNMFAYNDIGVAFMPNVKRNRFTENSFLENMEQVAILGSGSVLENPFSVDGRGNYWSDYRGFDLDRDGLGDIEFRADALFENLIDRDPRTRLFLFSPAQHAIAMAARAFPVVAPRPKIVDPHPLMSAQPVPVATRSVSESHGSSFAPFVLLAVAFFAVLPAWLPKRALARIAPPTLFNPELS